MQYSNSSCGNTEPFIDSNLLILGRTIPGEAILLINFQLPLSYSTSQQQLNQFSGIISFLKARSVRGKRNIHYSNTAASAYWADCFIYIRSGSAYREFFGAIIAFHRICGIGARTSYFSAHHNIPLHSPKQVFSSIWRRRPVLRFA